jgi:hypothetical protein
MTNPLQSFLFNIWTCVLSPYVAPLVLDWSLFSIFFAVVQHSEFIRFCVCRTHLFLLRVKLGVYLFDGDCSCSDCADCSWRSEGIAPVWTVYRPVWTVYRPSVNCLSPQCELSMFRDTYHDRSSVYVHTRIVHLLYWNLHRSVYQLKIMRICHTFVWIATRAYTIMIQVSSLRYDERFPFLSQENPGVVEEILRQNYLCGMFHTVKLVVGGAVWWCGIFVVVVRCDGVLCLWYGRFVVWCVVWYVCGNFLPLLVYLESFFSYTVLLIVRVFTLCIFISRDVQSNTQVKL